MGGKWLKRTESIFLSQNLILVVLILLAFSSVGVSAFNVPLGRRSALEKAAGALVTSSVADVSFSPANAIEISNTDSRRSSESTFKAYRLKTDSSANLVPRLDAVGGGDLIRSLARGNKGGAVWLGEHHNAEKDHNLQAEFIRRIYKEKRATSSKSLPTMAIGLEQVQVQFQGALDDFVSGNISEEEMKKQVDWEQRWVWPFEAYRPVFSLAKELKIPLIALNVDSEDLKQVSIGGLPGLSRSRLHKYIPDPNGFAEFVKPLHFSTYVNYVIEPSYELHDKMGLLKYTMSGEKLEEKMTYRNFFSVRILWDEAMASGASTWTDANPGGLLIGLVGADHVKFSNGIPGRYERMADGRRECTSIMLNPTLIDSRPAGTVHDVADSTSSQYPDRLTLQLRYLKEDIDSSSPVDNFAANTGGVLAFSDYIVVG